MFQPESQNLHQHCWMFW